MDKEYTTPPMNIQPQTMAAQSSSAGQKKNMFNGGNDESHVRWSVVSINQPLMPTALQLLNWRDITH